MGSVQSGLDQEMPGSDYLGQALLDALKAGTVTEAQVRGMATRILTTFIALDLVDRPPTGNLNANATSTAHNALARTLAVNGSVLLKNKDKTLPLNKKALRSVAVIGDLSTVTGGGSGHVIPPYIVDSLQGVSNALNGDHPRPANCTFLKGTDFFQPGNPSVSASSAQDCCAKCTANSGCNAFAYEASGTCWLKPNTNGRVANPNVIGGICAPLPAGAVNITYNDGSDPAAAAALAASADVAIVIVATTSSEGSDRPSLALPAEQDAYVAAVAKAQSNTVVVVRSPGAVLMPWVDDVPAILATFMPGQEAGNAMADVLFGDANPSGRLPLTFLASESDSWLTSEDMYPGVKDSDGNLAAHYTEGLEMGYRWMDAKNIQPLFAFGHGLSYSSFAYSDLTVTGTVTPTSSATVSFTVTNTAGPAGSDIPQLYLAFPSSAGEPPKLLRGFQKVSLESGGSVRVSLPLSAQDCSIFSNNKDDFELVAGAFTVLVGASSRDILLHGDLTVHN